MPPTRTIPLDTESANYREWIATVDTGTYCIIQDAGTWAVLQYNEHTRQWDETTEEVDSFLAVNNLLLLEGAPLQGAPPMEPMTGYDFRHDGVYDKKHYLKDEHQLTTFMQTHVVRAFMEGREAMVTDSGDNAVFHVKAGKVEWAGGANIAEITSTIRALGVKQNDLQAKLRDSLEKSRQTIGYRIDGLER